MTRNNPTRQALTRLKQLCDTEHGTPTPDTEEHIKDYTLVLSGLPEPTCLDHDEVSTIRVKLLTKKCDESMVARR